MKYILTILLFVATFGCAPSHDVNSTHLRSDTVAQLVADTHSIIVVDDGGPRLITNRTGQVLQGNAMLTVGTTTSRQEIAKLTEAIAETGMHGSSGVNFSGALPSHIFLNAEGEPLVKVLVHVQNHHVILSTNMTILENQIYAIHPTAGSFEAKPTLPSGDNPAYGNLALQMVKRIWPEECVRRDLKGAEDLIQAHKEAEERQREAKRTEQLLKISGSL